MSVFMQGNKIESFAVYILIIVYLIHIVLMKLNHSYEVFIKKAVSAFLEVKELKRLANEDISHFHVNIDTRYPSIEVLNKINFK